MEFSGCMSKNSWVDGSSIFNCLRKHKIVFHMDILIGTPPMNTFNVLYSSVAIILLRIFFCIRNSGLSLSLPVVSVWMSCQGESEHIKYIGQHSPLL